MMILLQHSQQLKSLAFFNKNNVANAARLQKVLLQQQPTQAADIEKVQAFIMINRPLLKMLHSNDNTGQIVVYGESVKEKTDRLKVELDEESY